MKCHQLSERASTLPDHGNNRVNYSELSVWSTEDYVASTYSIKYVLEGTEHYRIDNRLYSVTAGNFLVVNNNRKMDVQIRSQKKVRGLCFHLAPALLQQLDRSVQQMIDDPLTSAAPPVFDELIYASQENELGHYLHQIKRALNPQSATIRIEEDEMYDRLGRRLLALRAPGSEGGKVTAMRNSTRSELIRRLEIARQLIDETNAFDLDITTLARTAMLSPSYFLSGFKKLYRISPYQYMMKRRLTQAQSMLHAGHLELVDIALACGFADGAAFSRAYKKEFGIAPSLQRKQIVHRMR